MDKVKYLAVPLGTASGLQWRGVVDGWPDGFKIFYEACQLAELAVSCNAGGAILHRSGEPMTGNEIAAALGVAAAWADSVLFPALERLGEGRWSDGRWACSSPMVAITLSHLDAKNKTLPKPGKGKRPGRPPKYDRSLTPAERKIKQRTGQLPADVTPINGNKGTESVTIIDENVTEVSHKENDDSVTSEPQDAVITDEKKCHKTPNTKVNKKVNKKLLPVVVAPFENCPKTKPHPQLFDGTWKNRETQLSMAAAQNPDVDIYLLADQIDYQHSVQPVKSGQRREPMGLLINHLWKKQLYTVYAGYSPDWRERRDANLVENKPMPSIEEQQKEENEAIMAEKLEVLSAWRALSQEEQATYRATVAPDSWLFAFVNDEETIAAAWWRDVNN